MPAALFHIKTQKENWCSSGVVTQKENNKVVAALRKSEKLCSVAMADKKYFFHRCYFLCNAIDFRRQQIDYTRFQPDFPEHFPQKPGSADDSIFLQGNPVS